MPVKPRKNEDEETFISRCMSEEKESFPQQDQRLAVCYSYWSKKDEMSSEDITDDLDEDEVEDEQFAYATKESQEFATLPTTNCMEKHQSAGYTEEYAKQACSPRKRNDGQQGGVVSMSKDMFGRTKFVYSPNPKETMSDFMARCMSDDMVREKKKDRGMRAGFCYSNYQSKYIANIAKGWK